MIYNGDISCWVTFIDVIVSSMCPFHIYILYCDLKNKYTIKLLFLSNKFNSKIMCVCVIKLTVVTVREENMEEVNEQTNILYLHAGPSNILPFIIQLPFTHSHSAFPNA